MDAPAANPAGAGGRRGRGRPPGRRAEDTRELILDAAVRLFGAAGYDGVSMEALAAACDLNARALYYYFPSKRDLFEAARDRAFDRFGAEVVAKVFVHDGVRERIAGYLDVYRALHAAEPQLVPFIGRVLVDARASAAGGPGRASPEGEALRHLLEALVDDARARREVHPELDREGALALLAALGTGISLVALDEDVAFPEMLDALELLVDGSLLSPPPG